MVYRWLDTGCEDREIERCLHPLTEVDVPPPKPEGEDEEKVSEHVESSK